MVFRTADRIRIPSLFLRIIVGSGDENDDEVEMSLSTQEAAILLILTVILGMLGAWSVHYQWVQLQLARRRRRDEAKQRKAENVTRQGVQEVGEEVSTAHQQSHESLVAEVAKMRDLQGRVRTQLVGLKELLELVSEKRQQQQQQMPPPQGSNNGKDHSDPG